MRGWQSTIRELIHRKELVAGGLSGYATSEFEKAAERVRDIDADWNEVEDEAINHSLGSWSIFTEPFKQLPQVCLLHLLQRKM